MTKRAHFIPESQEQERKQRRRRRGRVQGDEGIVQLAGVDRHDGAGPIDGACLFDINRDGLVNIADLDVLLASFGRPMPRTRCQGDLNGDLRVNAADLAAFLAEFGAPCP